jgi:hypothetical protein
MRELRASFGALIFICLVTAPASALPFSARTAMNHDWPVQKTRLVCDEFARCWQSQSAPYGPRASQPYVYYDRDPAYRYSGYASGVRSPTKWERKGFCPPGQRKKGNC